MFLLSFFSPLLHIKEAVMSLLQASTHLLGYFACSLKPFVILIQFLYFATGIAK
jgi:hypothetical protein